MTRKYNRKSKKLKKQKMNKIRSKSVRLSRKRQRTRRKINKRRKRTYKKRKFIMKGGVPDGWFFEQMNDQLKTKSPAMFLTWFSDNCINNNGSLNETGKVLLSPGRVGIWSAPALGDQAFWSNYLESVIKLLN